MERGEFFLICVCWQNAYGYIYEGERVCVCVGGLYVFVCVDMSVVPPFRSTCAVSTVEHMHTSIFCTFYRDGAYACMLVCVCMCSLCAAACYQNTATQDLPMSIYGGNCFNFFLLLLLAFRFPHAILLLMLLYCHPWFFFLLIHP